MKNILFQLLSIFCLFVACNSSNPSQDNPQAATSIDTGSTPHYAKQIIEGPIALTDSRPMFLIVRCRRSQLGLKLPTIMTLYRFGHSQAAAAAQMGFADTIEVNQWLFIADIVEAVTIHCKTEQRVGIGLRYFVLVKSFPGGPPLQLAALGDRVETGSAQATYEIESLGTWKSNQLMTGFPVKGIFNICAARRLSTIRKTMEKYLKTSRDSIAVVALPKQ